jgi:DNA gyrase subunit A
MLITTGGVLVRTPVAGIREMGRATQGVTLISVDDGSTLSGVRRVVESDVDDEGDDESLGNTTPDASATDAPDEAGSES